MTDYKKLVEALRILQDKNSLSYYKRQVCKDAADAIEKLITLYEKSEIDATNLTGKLAQAEAQLTDYAAAIEDMAKHITEMHERVTVLQIARGELEAEVKRLEPKRGEWVKNEERYGWHCSCCKVDNRYAYSWNSETMKNEIQDNYCPNCGAKMEVQE